MARRSLETQLQIGQGAALFLLVAGIWWFGHIALQQTMETLILSRLEHDAHALAAALHKKGNGRFGIDRGRQTAVYNQAYSGHYYVLDIEGEKQVHSRSLWDWNMEVRQLETGQVAHWRVDGPSGQKLLVWGGGFKKSGTRFSLTVAQDISPLEKELNTFEWLLAGLALAGYLILLLLLRHFVHRAFTQLEPVYADIEKLEKGASVSLTEDVPAEVLPLVRKLNHLLKQYRRRLERSRNAAGNLAHALKTPLNLLVQRLDQTRPGMEAGQHADMGRQVRRIQQLMERELKRSRFAGSTPGQTFQPTEELPTLAQVLIRMYDGKSVEFRYLPDDMETVHADREDMLELLGNLLDNACKWAHSRILCTVEQTSDTTRFIVEDDGPGCNEEEMRQIATRGVRLDESTSGHGLGLSIVKDIVPLYRGDIQFGRSKELGGFRVEIQLKASTGFVRSR